MGMALLLQKETVISGVGRENVLKKKAIMMIHMVNMNNNEKTFDFLFYFTIYCVCVTLIGL